MKQFMANMARRLDDLVEARQVFQANAQATRAFSGRVIGRYVRQGANPWDPFKVQTGDEGDIRIFPGIELQVEKAGAVFRMRAKGTVLLVSWVPGDDIAEEARRDAFLESCVGGFRHARGIGATAFIAKTLGAG